MMDVLDIICMGHCEDCDFDMAQCLLQGYCEYEREDDEDDD